MKEFKAENISKSYGDKILFDHLNFMIHEKDRIGLIGINGTGKSSLMRIVARKSEPDDGEFSYPQDYRIGYLSQETTFPENWTVLEVVFQGDTPIMRTVRAYEQALLDLEKDSQNEKVQAAYTKAENEMNQHDAWLAETNAKTILTQLGITKMNQTFGSLSGGQQKRVGLAQVLIQAPDLLLLDEPTNHLDYRTIQWLEKYLASYQGAVMVITHDRYFLDRVTNRIFELSNGRLYEYKGNYQSYLQGKAERLEEERTIYHKQKQLYKQELAWMRAGVQGRGTKQVARKKRFYDLKDAMTGPFEEEKIDLDLATTRLGKKVFELKDASLTIDGRCLFHDLNLLIQNNERLGITGENGAGKTSLLNVLAQKLPLTTGTLDIGETVRIAYYQQTNIEMDPNKRIIQYLQEVAEESRQKDQTTISVPEMLERFLFPRSTHGTLIGKLSGGEKRRLYLLQLLMQQPNVLLLDEPTNDLDIDTLTMLEDYIEHFNGAVITVSHDRYFLDKVAKRLLLFEGSPTLRLYYGLSSDYFEALAFENKETESSEMKPKENRKQRTEKVKMTYNEQKEWETIEDEIEALENKIETLSEDMQHCGSDFVKLGDLQKELDEANQELEAKMARWEYLDEIATKMKENK